MAKYLFVLGRDRILSREELFSKVKGEILLEEEDILILELDEFDQTIDDFGGIIKLGNEINLSSIELNKDKIKLAVNSQIIIDVLKPRLKDLRVKYAITKLEIPEIKPSDYEILEVDKRFFLMQASSPKEYKKRDEVRPRFDEKKVTSIRLAKILINLSKAKKEILDPFCGCGTILQEALLKNLNAYGLDLDLQDSKENLSWLRQNFKINKKFTLQRGDVRNLSKYFKQVECIVTEPYLGPYLKTYPPRRKAIGIIDEVSKLYSLFLREASKIVKHRLIILTPIIKTKEKQRIRLNFKDLIREFNFHAVTEPITYKLKRSIIEREIWILEHKSKPILKNKFRKP
jgi:tRNA G10  N-methylase Trm11